MRTRKLTTVGQLIPAAADAYEHWRAMAYLAGYDLKPTSAFDTLRPYKVQEKIFRERYTTKVLTGRPYRYWKGQRWYQKPFTATAAVPGAGNHPAGVAIDIHQVGGFGSDYYAWLSKTGPVLGFTNTEGRSVSEPWHWVYKKPTKRVDHFAWKITRRPTYKYDRPGGKKILKVRRFKVFEVIRDSRVTIDGQDWLASRKGGYVLAADTKGKKK